MSLLKNSERIKKILVNMAIDTTLPVDMNELDEDLFSFCDATLTNNAKEDLINLYKSCNEGATGEWIPSEEGFKVMMQGIKTIAKELNIKLPRIK